MFTFPLGNTRVTATMANVRTEHQRGTVRSLIERDDFDFACANPFVPEVATYVGVFTFTYYTKDGTFHSVRIGTLGDVLQAVAIDANGNVI